MTEKELKSLEKELQKRGYRKWTRGLTDNETYGWFKTFGNEDDGCLMEFRVWGPYDDPHDDCYGFDIWTTALGTDSRMDFTSNWEPICDIDTFERMAAEFNQMARKFIKK